MLAMVWEEYPVVRASGNEELELELELELAGKRGSRNRRNGVKGK